MFLILKQIATLVLTSYNFLVVTVKCFSFVFQDLDLLVPACKLMRLGNSNGDGSQSVPSLAFGDSENENSKVIKDPLASALRKLFQTLNVIVVRDGEVSQQTHFVLRFIQLIVFSGKEHALAVLHNMPNTLVRLIIIQVLSMLTCQIKDSYLITKFIFRYQV